MQSATDKEWLMRLRDCCRRHGLRVTPQREAIYKELYGSRRHPTAEQMHARIQRRYSSISLDTVNRTLLTFAKIGLVDIVEGYGSPRRYDPNRGSHHHAHCIKCGAILDFESPELDKLKVPAAVRREFKVLNRRVVFSGLCAKCAGGLGKRESK